MSEVITRYVDVIFDGTYKQVVEGVYQYDHGLKLRVRGVPTDVEWQMQFCIRGSQNSVTSIATVSDGKVIGDIPDTLLMQQREVLCYLYYEDTNYGITVYEIYLPLRQRPQPATGTYTPEQIEAYDELVASLQALISDSNEAISDLVLVQEEQPTSEGNKLWIEPTGLEYQVPTEAEFEGVRDGIAPLYEDLTFPVVAGQYCWYSNVLYKAKQDIATSEAWTSAHWETAVLCDDVTSVAANVSTVAEIKAYLGIA